LKTATRWLFLTAVITAQILFRQTAAAQHGHGNPTNSPSAVTCEPVTGLAQFVDALPIPAIAVPARTNSNYPLLPGVALPEYDMPMLSLQHKFHRDLPPVEVWGYTGTYPGPTFEVQTNAPILVNWINQLPATYPSWLAPDTNIHGVPDLSVRTVVHLHGGATRPQFDGYPTNWFRTGTTNMYLYENIDFTADGETLWYHDHAIGATANNVYSGLEGFYLLRNSNFENNLNIPTGAYEIPLVFQDRDVQTNCAPATMMFNGLPPWHNLAVVNGKVTPYLEVEPRKYRFRILNGSNFRAFGLQFAPTNGQSLNWNIIGTENGFVQSTVTTKTLLMMSAERMDVIVDFTKFTNNNITLINSIGNANVPFAPFITNIMQFRVTLPLSSPDTNQIPGTIVTNWVQTSNMVSEATVNREVTLDLCFPDDTGTNCVWLGGPFATDPHVNALLNLSYFEDPITDFPHAGDTEIWHLINLTSEAHPIHVHLLDFRVVDRVRFGGFNAAGNLAYPPTMVTNYINDRRNGVLQPLSYYLSTNSSDMQSVKAFEAGPKDTVHAAPFGVTRIVMTWPDDSRFYGQGESSDTHGRYIYHCHILDHEDNDMMRPMQLLPPRPPLQALFHQDGANGNKLKLRLKTKSSEKYRIHSSTAIDPFVWTPLAIDEIQGTGQLIDVVPPANPEPVRFYKVEPSAKP